MSAIRWKNAFRVALRSLIAARWNAAAAVLVLSVAAAAGHSIAAIWNSTVERRLSWRNADEIVEVRVEGDPDETEQDPAAQFRPGQLLSSIEVALLSESAESLAWIGAASPRRTVVGGSDRARVAFTAELGPGALAALGVSPVVGRGFHDADYGAAGAGADALLPILLRADLASSLFGSAEDAVGGRLDLGPQRAEVIGVMPRDFTFPGGVFAVWQPAPPPRSDLLTRAPVAARLAPGASASAAARRSERHPPARRSSHGGRARRPDALHRGTHGEHPSHPRNPARRRAAAAHRGRRQRGQPQALAGAGRAARLRDPPGLRGHGGGRDRRRRAPDRPALGSRRRGRRGGFRRAAPRAPPLRVESPLRRRLDRRRERRRERLLRRRHRRDAGGSAFPLRDPARAFRGHHRRSAGLARPPPLPAAAAGCRDRGFHACPGGDGGALRERLDAARPGRRLCRRGTGCSDRGLRGPRPRDRARGRGTPASPRCAGGADGGAARRSDGGLRGRAAGQPGRDGPSSSGTPPEAPGSP